MVLGVHAAKKLEMPRVSMSQISTPYKEDQTLKLPKTLDEAEPQPEMEVKPLANRRPVRECRKKKWKPKSNLLSQVEEEQANLEVTPAKTMSLIKEDDLNGVLDQDTAGKSLPKAKDKAIA